jgi:hypothetical protein
MLSQIPYSCKRGETLRQPEAKREAVIMRHADTLGQICPNLCEANRLGRISQAANRDAFRTLGPLNTLLPIYEELQDARSIILTGNDNTVYNWVWLDLSKGPMVLEVPPKVLGTANDMWQRWVVDVGITGPDKGEGGKYLFLPPGYKGDVPSKGYVKVVHSPTFSLWIPWRSFLVDGNPKPGIDLVKKYTKIYPLSDAGKNHPPLKVVNMSGKPFNTVFPTDFKFWKLLN